MWSAGCIIAEVLTEKVLFPGKSSLNQMELVIELLGRPSESDLHSMHISYDSHVVEALSKKKRTSFSEIFQNHD